MKLPEPIAEWAKLLEAVPDDVRDAVVGLAARLAPAIGPFPPTQAAPGSDVDGYAGLGRRGPYERLLLSEWALAQAAPLEFLRRAAEREHLFYELSRRGAAPRRRSLAIFDGGPQQLGGPRIAHLALILLLGARARRAGADFWWAVGQTREPVWVREVDATTLPALFHGRASEPLLREHVDALLRREGADAEDIWVVGDGTTPIPAHVHRVVVEDLLDETPGTQRLRVRVVPDGRIERRVELEMPPPGIAARIVADPFRRPALPTPTGPVVPAPTSRLVFAAASARLLASWARGYFSVSVPSREEIGPKVTRHEAPRPARTLALQYVAGGLWALVHVPGADEVVLQQYQRRRRTVSAELRFRLRGETLPETPSLGDLFRRGTNEWILRLGNQVWRLQAHAERLATGIVALAPGRTYPEHFLAVSEREIRSAEAAVLAKHEIRVLNDLDYSRVLAAWFAHGQLRAAAARVCAAVTVDGAWVDRGAVLADDGVGTFSTGSRVALRLPGGATAVGAYLDGDIATLVTISADRRRLEAHADPVLRPAPWVLYESEASLVEATLSVARPEAAVLDAAGGIAIVALRSRRVIGRATVRPERG